MPTSHSQELGLGTLQSNLAELPPNSNQETPLSNIVKIGIGIVGIVIVAILAPVILAAVTVVALYIVSAVTSLVAMGTFTSE
ncbi:hypothetical protein DL96DRAFT_1793988 [Flagelloscypha sp. PMI_526]|nr:hypothetical protein DL96DRAFT_1793988 [Flagelloscypha sp. PMI_526]